MGKEIMTTFAAVGVPTQFINNNIYQFMSQNEINVNVEYLVKNGLVNYTDGDIVVMDSRKHSHLESVLRLEMVSIMYIERGIMQADLNGKTVKAGADDLVACPPHTFVNNAMSSDDFEAKIITLSYQAIQKSLLLSKDVWNLMAFIARNPVVHLSPESSETIRRYHSLISYKIEKPHGYYHKEIMQSLFHGIFYELAAIIAPQLSEISGLGQFSQGEVLFKRFIEQLTTFETTDRSVKAYAERLCVTPKYLSTVCKAVSGKTALEWIHEFLAGSITQKLKYTDSSIKEIADDLGFPNISFFGKFVKSQFGVSPKEYRTQLRQTPNKVATE